MENVRSCDVFSPLLTASYRTSEWTDQESGMAIILSKIIMPLSVTRNPHGFLAKYQAFKIDTKNIGLCCTNLVLLLKNRPELKSRVQNSYIQKFVASGGFVEANTRSELLQDFGPYSPSQINEIIRGSLVNSQVCEAFTAQRKLRELFSKNKESVESDLRKRFTDTFGEST
jgi:hypothetical protein